MVCCPLACVLPNPTPANLLHAISVQSLHRSHNSTRRERVPAIEPSYKHKVEKEIRLE